MSQLLRAVDANSEIEAAVAHAAAAETGASCTAEGAAQVLATQHSGAHLGGKQCSAL